MKCLALRQGQHDVVQRISDWSVARVGRPALPHGNFRRAKHPPARRSSPAGRGVEVRPFLTALSCSLA